MNGEFTCAYIVNGEFTCAYIVNGEFTCAYIVNGEFTCAYIVNGEFTCGYIVNGEFICAYIVGMYLFQWHLCVSSTTTPSYSTSCSGSSTLDISSTYIPSHHTPR